MDPHNHQKCERKVTQTLLGTNTISNSLRQGIMFGVMDSPQDSTNTYLKCYLINYHISLSQRTRTSNGSLSWLPKSPSRAAILGKLTKSNTSGLVVTIVVTWARGCKDKSSVFRSSILSYIQSIYSSFSQDHFSSIMLSLVPLLSQHWNLGRWCLWMSYEVMKNGCLPYKIAHYCLKDCPHLH